MPRHEILLKKGEEYQKKQRVKRKQVKSEDRTAMWAMKQRPKPPVVTRWKEITDKGTYHSHKDEFKKLWAKSQSKSISENKAVQALAASIKLVVKSEDINLPYWQLPTHDDVVMEVDQPFTHAIIHEEGTTEEDTSKWG